MDNVAVLLPADVGANVTASVVEAPAASVTLPASLKLSENCAASVPLIVVASMTRLVVPWLVSCRFKARRLTHCHAAKRERRRARRQAWAAAAMSPCR